MICNKRQTQRMRARGHSCSSFFSVQTQEIASFPMLEGQYISSPPEAWGTQPPAKHNPDFAKEPEIFSIGQDIQKSIYLRQDGIILIYIRPSSSFPSQTVTPGCSLTAIPTYSKCYQGHHH